MKKFIKLWLKFFVLIVVIILSPIVFKVFIFWIAPFWEIFCIWIGVVTVGFPIISGIVILALFSLFITIIHEVTQ